MDKIYTIGFTKKTAKEFFDLINNNDIEILVDVRLNNKSQLAGFSKYPDIKYFLEVICSVGYVNDLMLAPTEDILKDYKKGLISWEEYVLRFFKLMKNRKIKEYIAKEYSNAGNICLLCSEDKHDNCHRSLVAEIFRDTFACEVIHMR